MKWWWIGGEHKSAGAEGNNGRTDKLREHLEILTEDNIIPRFVEKWLLEEVMNGDPGLPHPKAERSRQSNGEITHVEEP